MQTEGRSTDNEASNDKLELKWRIKSTRQIKLQRVVWHNKGKQKCMERYQKLNIIVGRAFTASTERVVETTRMKIVKWTMKLRKEEKNETFI